MNSRRRSSRPQLLLLGVVVVCAVGYLFMTTGARVAMRDAFTGILRGAQAASTEVASLHLFSTRSALARELEKVSRERDVLKAEALENELLKAENGALRALVHLSEEQHRGAAARALSRPGVSPYGTFIISRPDTVAVGDVVLAAPGVAVGTIVEVGERTALVRLFSAPGNSVEARLGVDAMVTYQGKGGGNGEVQAPRGVPAAVGDPLFFADGSYAIGTVAVVEAEPADAYQVLRFGPPVNLNALTYVYVVAAHKD